MAHRRRQAARRDPGGSAADPGGLILAALDDLAGPLLVLDSQLRVVAATASAGRLLGAPVPLGVTAPALLCGGSVDRPIATALARGKPVTGSVHRPDGRGGERVLLVRASPMGGGARASGWTLLLGDEQSGEDGEAPVHFHGLWTRDPALKQVLRVVERAARRDATVLVRGESGTGKELIAHALHELSPRRRGPFRAINCAALPPTLLESELFGHVRGAFTGAVRDHPGLFRTAEGGTVFLDEVAELSLELQAKLLRVLETRTVLPVGAREPVAVNVRIVAATHQSLRALVEQGAFRADLMYRLRVVPVRLPPLRERKGDVLLLTQRLLEALNAEGGRQIVRLSRAAEELLLRHSWPGNVRELSNALQYAYVVGDGPVLMPGDLPPELQDGGAVSSAVNAPDLERPPAEGGPEARDRRRILHALERAGGHRGRAAQILGMSRVTLWRRLRELGLVERAARSLRGQ